MKVQFSVVGFVPHPEVPLDVEMEMVPRVGEVVEIPGMPGGQVHVRSIVHFPWGDGDSREPFTYIVLGLKRYKEGEK